MNYTQSLGNCNELKCLTKFIEMGYECSIPYGNGAKYDFIVDVNGTMLRIQCKSASITKKKNGELDDAITIYTISQTTNTQKTIKHRYDKSQIDYFATSYKEKVYLIPVEECSTAKTLRFSAPANNQNYNKAEDYEIEKQLNYSEDLLQSKKSYEEKKSDNKEIKKFYCKECGEEITSYSQSGLCSICKAKSTRIVERPSREELKAMIRKEPFTQIASNFGVSDKAITKWCVAMNLPSRKKDIKTYTNEEWDKI